MTTGAPLIFGEVLFDCFPDGNEVMGGAPFNVAWHLQGFGLNPLLVSRVGNDARGDQIREAMHNWGMSLSGLQSDNTHATGEVTITINSGEPEFDIIDDRAYDHIHGEQLPAKNPVVIYHGSLTLRHKTSARALSDIRNRYQSPVFIDVNLRPPWWDRETLEYSLHGSTWVKLNEQELAHLLPEASDMDILERAHSFVNQYGLQLLIVTLGKAGALAVDKNGESHSVRPEAVTPVVDTVGAGDAFSSVVILGLLSDWPTQKTLERAQQFASIVVGVRGAIIQERDIYQQLIHQWGNNKK